MKVCECCNHDGKLPTREEILKRDAEVREQESPNPEVWFYLSFAEAKPPYGRGFLGGFITKARGFASAIHKATILGYNPGGEVAGGPWPNPDFVPDPKYVDRLLTREEVNEL